MIFFSQPIIIQSQLILNFIWRKYDDLMVDEETDDYHIQFDGMYEGSLYSFRILAVNDQLDMVAKTSEVSNWFLKLCFFCFMFN